MSLTFERKLPIVLTFVFFVLTTVGILSYQSTLSIREELSRQKRTRDVLVALDDVLTNNIDIDTAVMRFTITGNDTYLAMVSREQRAISESMTELDALTAADQQQDFAQHIRVHEIFRVYLRLLLPQVSTIAAPGVRHRGSSQSRP